MFPPFTPLLLLLLLPPLASCMHMCVCVRACACMHAAGEQVGVLSDLRSSMDGGSSPGSPNLDAYKTRMPDKVDYQW